MSPPNKVPWLVTVQGLLSVLLLLLVHCLLLSVPNTVLFLVLVLFLLIVLFLVLVLYLVSVFFLVRLLFLVSNPSTVLIVVWTVSRPRTGSLGM